MYTIARFTLLKVFEPAFIFLFSFGIFVAYITSSGQGLDLSFVSEIVGDNAQGNLNISVLILLLLAGIISIFVGSTEIPRDLNSRMITILLSKPISRRQYVVGRFLGSWALSALLFIGWHSCSCIFQYMQMPDLFSFSNFFINFICIFALAPICAICITVSTYLDDVPAMIVSFIIVAVCFTMGTVPIIVKLFSADLGKILLLFYYMLPNLTYFFQDIKSVYHAIAYSVYSLSLSMIILKIAVMHFDERDLIEG